MAANSEAKRERRRRDLARMKAKAMRLFPSLDDATRIADHLAVCSCWMCGNPRRYFGALSIQERRAPLPNKVSASDLIEDVS
jgi:hypothetical protein